MNCVWEEFGERNEAGWRRVRCLRTGCTWRAKPLNPTPDTHENIQAKCTGLPLASEWQEWLILFAEPLGLTKAAAVCEFIRWRFRGSKLDELPPGIPRPMLPPPDAGPGTELHRLLTSLGVTPDASCACEAMRQRMNAWGTAGCREHRGEIIDHLRQAYKQTDWPTVFAAALAGIGLVWRINPLHPIESGLAALLDEAIERAEKAAAK